MCVCIYMCICMYYPDSNIDTLTIVLPYWYVMPHTEHDNSPHHIAHTGPI